MAQQRQQRGRGGGVLRLVAVLLLAVAVALLSLCADAVTAPWASLAGAAPASESEHGVAIALERALPQEAVARGHYTASTAAAEEEEEEEEGDGDVVPERVAMESTQDYSFASANTRHVPHPYP